MNRNPVTGESTREAGLRVPTNSRVEDAVRRLRRDLAKSRPFPTGTIIAWESISYNGIEYHYAAVFASGKWYTTIAKDNPHLKKEMTHEELMAYFNERGDHLADLRVASSFDGVAL